MCAFVCLCWRYESLIHGARRDRKSSCPCGCCMCARACACIRACVCVCVGKRELPSASWLYLLCWDEIHYYFSIISVSQSETEKNRFPNVTLARRVVTLSTLRGRDADLPRFLTVPIVCWNVTECPWNDCFQTENLHRFSIMSITIIAVITRRYRIQFNEGSHSGGLWRWLIIL